jgi:prevent-host-death family protein
MKVTSTEFQQNVGRYQDAALTEPVIITKNGRDKNVLISAAAFDQVTICPITAGQLHNSA